MPVNANPSLPLQGIMVTALEQAVAGPLCSRHLADLGAEVIKVERPGQGDMARHYDEVVDGLSANFVWLNHSKKSVALDLKAESDRDCLWQLLDESDVFLHNLGPGAVERLGFGFPDVHRRNPRAIWCGISGYGTDGPYRNRKAFDLLLQGEAAVMAVTGSEEEPAKVGLAIADVAAGTYALAAILAVLYRRQVSGVGERIDISMFDCLAEWMSYPTLLATHGQPTERNASRHSHIVPYGLYRCADGKAINLAVQTEAQWRALCTVIGRESWAMDPRLGSVADRETHRGEIEAGLEAFLAVHSSEEAIQLLDRADVPVGLIRTVAEFASHPQLTERLRWVSCDSPGGEVGVITHPLNILGIPRHPGPIPRLGEDTDSILARLGSSRTAVGHEI